MRRLRRQGFGVVLAMGVALAIVACGDSDTPSDPGNGGNGDPPPPPATGTVSGTIEDDVGSALASIGVALRESGSVTESETTSSNATGQFSFADIDVGDWDVVVTVPATHALDGQPNPVFLTVVENQTATADFELRLRAGTVAGAVLTDTGDPVRDVTIVISESGAAVEEGTTSASGAYAIDRIPVGSYDVTVEAPAATVVVGADELAADVTDLATATADFELELLPVSLATHVQPVFSNRCVGCHVGADAPDGLELTVGDAYAHTVGVAAVQLPTMDLISPADPDDSYLVHKIQGTHVGVGGAANRMPLGAAPLRDQVIDLIRRWVAEGAPDN